MESTETKWGDMFSPFEMISGSDITDMIFIREVQILTGTKDRGWIALLITLLTHMVGR